MAWNTDPGCEETWPEWFLEYRRTTDAEMHAKSAAVQRGELTKADYAAWALESAEREVRWQRSLPSDLLREHARARRAEGKSR